MVERPLHADAIAVGARTPTAGAHATNHPNRPSRLPQCDAEWTNYRRTASHPVLLLRTPRRGDTTHEQTHPYGVGQRGLSSTGVTGPPSRGAYMPKTRVLVVEDEPTVADVVVRYLERDGHEMEVTGDGPGALRAFDEFRPDLIVLDLMLPGLDGVEVCRRIRAVSNVPIVMLTARAEEADRLAGFGFGADDYVTKPFSPRELAARVEAVLRRTGRADDGENVLRHGDLRIDRRARTVETRAGELPLTAREFDLLLVLASHPRQVFTREQLITTVWDLDADTEENTVTVHMRRLRAKLEPDPSRPRYLKTVWGVGYKFEP